MKILPLGGAEFHAGGRTDITMLIVAFLNYAISPKTGERAISKLYVVHIRAMMSQFYD